MNFREAEAKMEEVDRLERQIDDIEFEMLSIDADISRLQSEKNRLDDVCLGYEDKMAELKAEINEAARAS